MSGSAHNKTLVGLGTESQANEHIYDDWAGNYEEDVARWGYTLPDDAAKLLSQHVDDRQGLAILDTGAGDGLTGIALRKVGFTEASITGSDISRNMLAKAATRGCYNETAVLDLNRPLDSIPSDTYDVVQCLGTLTYVSPEAGTLSEFIRICKPTGFVCYSHRTDKLDLWKDTEASLAGKWKLVQEVGPIPYLPNHPEYGESVQVVIFLYQVL